MATQRVIGLQPFITAYELYDQRREIKRISTGTRSLDDMPVGGNVVIHGGVLYVGTSPTRYNCLLFLIVQFTVPLYGGCDHVDRVRKT